MAFDTPYQQSAGEMLAFTIRELSGGGATGYNNYGNAVRNLYSGGQMFFTFSAGLPLTSSAQDLAFETLVVPEPSTATLIIFGAIGLMLVRLRTPPSIATPAHALKRTSHGIWMASILPRTRLVRPLFCRLYSALLRY